MQVFFGSGNPSGDIGVVGDQYRDNDSKKLYVKTDFSTWTVFYEADAADSASAASDSADAAATSASNAASSESNAAGSASAASSSSTDASGFADAADANSSSASGFADNAAASAIAAAASAVVAPVWTKHTVGFADLAFAGLTNDIELFSLPAKSMILAIFVKNTEAFTGGSISDYGVSIGIEGNLTHLLGASPFNVFAAPGDGNFAFNSIPVDVFDFGSATSIRIAATSVDDNLDQATAGSVDVYVQTSALPA